MQIGLLLGILGGLVEKLIPIITAANKFFIDNILWMSPALLGAAGVVVGAVFVTPLIVRAIRKIKFRNACKDALEIRSTIRVLKQRNEEKASVHLSQRIAALEDKLERKQAKALKYQKLLKKSFYRKKIKQDAFIEKNKNTYNENYSNSIGYVDDRNRISTSSRCIKNVYAGLLLKSAKSGFSNITNNHKLVVSYNKLANMKPEIAFASDKKVLKGTECAILTGIYNQASTYIQNNQPEKVKSLISRRNPITIERDHSKVKITSYGELASYIYDHYD